MVIEYIEEAKQIHRRLLHSNDPRVQLLRTHLMLDLVIIKSHNFTIEDKEPAADRVQRFVNKNNWILEGGQHEAYTILRD